jgi:hypothetical protein
MSKSEMAELIEAFLTGVSDDWDWDDFISIKQSNPEIEQIRLRCANLPWEFPPNRPGDYCNDDGAIILKNYVRRLRERGAS